MATLLNVIKTALGLEVFTHDNQLTPILRFGRFNRLAEPGFSRFNPILERALPPVSTEIRLHDLLFEEILSEDGIPFVCQLTLQFRFAPVAIDRDVAAQFVKEDGALLKRRIDHFASRGLRRLVGRYPALALCGGKPVPQIERDLFRYLDAELSSCGVCLEPGGGVLVRELVPPDRFKRTMLDANMHRVTLDVLSRSQGRHLIDQALQAELVASLDQVDANVILSPSLQDAVYTQLWQGNDGKKRNSPVA